jgi:hypothetical protein
LIAPLVDEAPGVRRKYAPSGFCVWCARRRFFIAREPAVQGQRGGGGAGLAVCFSKDLLVAMPMTSMTNMQFSVAPQGVTA